MATKHYLCSKYQGLRLSGGVKFRHGRFSTDEDEKQKVVENSRPWNQGHIMIIPEDTKPLRKVPAHHRAKRLEHQAYSAMEDRVAELQAKLIAEEHQKRLEKGLDTSDLPTPTIEPVPLASVAEAEPVPDDSLGPHLSDLFDDETPAPPPAPVAGEDPKPYNATQLLEMRKADLQEVAAGLGIETDQTVSKLRRAIRLQLGV